MPTPPRPFYLLVGFVRLHFALLLGRKLQHGCNHMRNIAGVNIHHVLIHNVAEVRVGVRIASDRRSRRLWRWSLCSAGGKRFREAT